MPGAFDSCVDGLKRVATIVSSMKEFAHPAQMEMSSVDLNHAIQSTLNITCNEYRYVADVETNFEELPPITCCVGEINRVVLNLIVNAAHAIEERVKGSQLGSSSALSITTSRCGSSQHPHAAPSAPSSKLASSRRRSQRARR